MFLGLTRPGYVLGGYVRRLWKLHEIDNVALLANGICVVRFKDEISKQTMLRSGPVFYDNKPLVVKKWQPDSRFYGLDLKFWGLALNKIAGLVGKPIRTDVATQAKFFLGFARIMVEVTLDQVFPDVIEFLDENDILHRQIVHYEWKPVKCSECRGMGHTARVCRKKKGQKTQPPATVQEPTQVETQPLPVIDPTAVVTPMPFDWRVLNTMTPAKMMTRMLKGADKSFGEGRTFMDRLRISIGDVRRLLHINNIGLCGLLETRVKSHAINKVKNGIGSKWQVIYNNDVREGGRIWLLWDDQVFHVDVLSKEAQVVHVRVTFLPKQFTWVMSLVYGFNKLHDRSSLWTSLNQLGQLIREPWLVMGDFNNVIHMDERIRSVVTTAEVQDFQDCMDSCGLLDLYTFGAFFTWNKKQVGQARVYSRIDRVLANDYWVLNGPASSISFLPEGLYDHSLCVLDLWQDGVKPKTSFHCFNMWGKSEDFLSIMAEVWA
ncbi:uncharacterized protein LOC141630798 [Silene latifolia]|uniref:uncharacterized protein LOC141630798 n=1 Tax=Silene latifolia TaxID=37657 RepID=UPI003D78181C